MSQDRQPQRESGEEEEGGKRGRQVGGRNEEGEGAPPRRNHRNRVPARLWREIPKQNNTSIVVQRKGAEARKPSAPLRKRRNDPRVLVSRFESALERRHLSGNNVRVKHHRPIAGRLQLDAMTVR